MELTPMERALASPLIDEIQLLKKQKNAVILAHNYMKPEVFHRVSDITGDSLALAQAVDVDADVIVMAGVHFMAETAKLLNPGKTVLIPDVRAGCSWLRPLRRMMSKNYEPNGPASCVCVRQHLSGCESRSRCLLHLWKRCADRGVDRTSATTAYFFFRIATLRIGSKHKRT